MQWPDGYQVNYAYDTSNRMLTATDSASTVLGTYTYDAMSRRTNLAYGNTASLAYAYTDAGDLTSLTNDFVTNSKNVVYTLTYNDAHQLASETISKSTYRYAPATRTDTYAPVNALNQYANVNGGTASGTDCHGNAQVMSYDCNGNLTGDGVWSFAYDPENHMVGASTSGTSAAYAYDPLGRRQMKAVSGGATTAFLSDGDDELAEYTNVGGTGALARQFVPGPAINDPIAYENCTALPCTGANMVTEYYHTDHHGSVIAMSGSTGNPVSGESNYTYDAYGYNASTSSGGQPFRYVGMYYDAETGLYQDRARVYSPYLGRFLQNDPIGYKDDVDLYTYTGDEPIDKLDPSGDGAIGDAWDRVAGNFMAPLMTTFVPDLDGQYTNPLNGQAVPHEQGQVTMMILLSPAAGAAGEGEAMSAEARAISAEARALSNATSAADMAVATHSGGKASSLVTQDGQAFTGLSNRGQPGWSENSAVRSTAESAPNAPDFAGHCAECGTASAALNAGAKTEGAVQATVKVGGRNHGQIAPPCAGCQAVQKKVGNYTGETKLTVESKINELIERVDLAFEKIGKLEPKRAHFMWIALANLARDQMGSQLATFFDLAKQHSVSGGSIDELNAAKALLASEDLKRITVGAPYDKAAFIRNLVRATLTEGSGIDYETGSSILSDCIWWLNSLGVSAEVIEATLVPFFSESTA